MEYRCGALSPPSSILPISAKRFIIFTFPNELKYYFVNIIYKFLVYSNQTGTKKKKIGMMNVLTILIFTNYSEIPPPFL